MPDPTPSAESGWTIETYAAHNEALREARKEFDQERDRRYAEISLEREKALKIKETADLAALNLARDIQIYKDEKANELREQINSERGRYLTRDEYQSAHKALIDKMDASFKPLNEYVSSQQGRQSGIGTSAAIVYAVLVLAVSMITVAIILYSTQHMAPANTVTVTTTSPTTSH